MFHAYTYWIKPRPPFAIMSHLRRFCLKNKPAPCIFDGKSCRRLVFIENMPVAYKVLIISEGYDPSLRLEVFARNRTLANRAFRIVKEIYRVDFDYQKFMETCRKHRRIYELAKKYIGLRPTGMISIYEALLDSIIEQNISLILAMRIKARFIRKFGEKIEINGEEYYSFPRPSVLANMAPERLKKEARLTMMKSKAIIEVANRIDELPSADEIEENPEEFTKTITRIKGIGIWTAQISIAKISKSFRVGPINDLSARRGFKYFLGISNEEKIRKLLDYFSEYAGLILYLMAFEGHNT